MPHTREMEIVERSLPVRLTDAETLAVSRQCAECVREIGQVESEKKIVMADIKARMEQIQKEVRRLSNIVRSGVEWREIPCEVRYHRDLAEVTVTRLDTGEVVETRPMTKEERQMAWEF